MNKFKLLLILLCAVNMFAQDVIITNDDNVIKAYNVEIGKNAIFYQVEDNEDAPIQKIAKSDVFIIKKADGTKIDPNETETVNAPVTVASTVSDEVSVNAEKVAKKNKELIDEWNSIHFELQKEKKTSSAKHNASLIKFGVKQTSQLTDGNIQVHYNIESNKYVKFGNTVSITVDNKTDKIVYVDMANSFYTSNKGVLAMYSNKVESKTNVNAVGMGLGLIGGASADAKTTVSTESRMIAVPPKGSVTLPYKISSPFLRYSYVIVDNYAYRASNRDKVGPAEKSADASALFVNPLQNLTVTTLEDLPMGNSLNFTEADSDVEMYALISYSFSETGQNIKSVRTDFFLQQILKMGFCSGGSFNDKAIGVDSLNPSCTGGMVFVPFDLVVSGQHVKYKWYCKE